MRAVVSSYDGLTTQWDATGLSSAFRELAAGHSIDLTGASGALWVDAETQTKVLNTTYMLWTINLAVSEDLFVPYSIIRPIIYLSTAGTSGEASTTAMWLLEKDFAQSFDDEEIEYHELPDATDCWAVVISPSTTWENYRHQADAFAMYQTLHHHGYDDDHIVFIVEDNLAYDPQNVFPGQIFVDRTDEYTPDDEQQPDTNNDDVRSQAVVDYHFSELRPEDLADIMMGRQSERLPHVIQTDSMSNVFFFWSGHGGSKEGPLWGNEDSEEYFGTDRIRRIVEEMDAANKYRRMMFALETCFSGKWGEALTGINDVLVLTAATPYETSKADVFNEDLGVFLSNAFARMFRKKINDYHFITIYDLFHELFRSTNGSHVSIYNEKNYGSVYVNRMYDYFPE
jgi:glycosylphosphatidylinositol transamidase (GPIT) subunit GPI8